MRRLVSLYDVVGGMRPAVGAAPFARGAAVLREESHGPSPASLLVARQFVGGEVEGDAADPETWGAFLDTGQATSLATPVPARGGEALWVLRQNFEERESLLTRIRDAGALTHREDRDGSIIAVVREDLANVARDSMGEEFRARALEAAVKDRWDEALVLADISFCLYRDLVPPVLALLVLCLDRVGRRAASEGMIEMAIRSRGDEFARLLRTEIREFERTCNLSRGKDSKK